MKNTQLGAFEHAQDFIKHLESQGYINLGWQNGWKDGSKEDVLWAKQKALENTPESIQWNRSGSHCMYVLHVNKVFCSVDMG